MPKMLTARTVEEAKPDRSRRIEIPDGLLSGLYLVVQPSGAKSWAIRYRHAGKPRKHTLGPFPALKLAGARDEAKTALQRVAKGEIRPLPSARPGARRPRAVTCSRTSWPSSSSATSAARRSKAEVERMFRHDVLPYWGERRIQDITRRDVIELMDRLRDRGVGSMVESRVLDRAQVLQLVHRPRHAEGLAVRGPEAAGARGPA